MPRGKTSGKPPKRPIERYEHRDKKRINNPPVGLVTPETDPPLPTHKVYDYVHPVPTVRPGKDLEYDPHLDPQLVWAGKKEHTSFEVPTVSLHVHERIDPSTIIETVRKRNGNGLPEQPSLFERREENPPLREAIDFYRHAHGWSNRLIAGDSLLVMNSLLEKEGMAGHVQMVYIDPPYGVKYGSDFQPFVNKRDVKDGKDEDLTQEPEMIRAFRDTWELGIHSYLTYLRDRLLLAKELLHESGSCFVQISDENLHHVRELMDEIFGREHACAIIAFNKTTSATSDLLPTTTDFLLWYARDIGRVKYRALYQSKIFGAEGASAYSRIEMADGTRRAMTPAEKSDISSIPPGARIYRIDNLTSQRPPGDFPVRFNGETYRPRRGYWKTGESGMLALIAARRLEATAGGLYYVRYLDDFPVYSLSNSWGDTSIAGFASDKFYVVQTTPKVIQRCVSHDHGPGRPHPRSNVWFRHNGVRCRAVGTPLDHL